MYYPDYPDQAIYWWDQFEFDYACVNEDFIWEILDN